MIYLIVLVNPKEGQVGYTNRFPMVLNLLSGTVDYVCHLICYDEFQILKSNCFG